jgi:hypothetical protein
VKAFTRRLCLAFVTMGMLAVTGCGPDNESAGVDASKKLGDPGKADPKGLPENKVTPPSDNASRAAQGPQGSINQLAKPKLPDKAATPK